MSGRSDSYLSFGLPEGTAATGCVVVVIAAAAFLAYNYAHSDSTNGLDYASGDKPEEMKNSACFNNYGPCPPSGFKWRIPASGVIQTQFKRENIQDGAKFRGSFRLDAAKLVEDEVRDCAAVVDWSLLADGKPLAHGTVKAGSDEQRVTGTPPRETRFVQFTARRTDTLNCRSTVQWIYAGLD
ncbi:hypothetical protein GCM10022254_40380 [Actinomadura meridiana]|uniref:Secreted protein n=1 Tax=Actinomadura meridiana TaxID=559626 RepID=A0ABP8C6W4_9ACTN